MHYATTVMPFERVGHQDYDNYGDRTGSSGVRTLAQRESGPSCVAPRAKHARALQGAYLRAFDQKQVDLLRGLSVSALPEGKTEPGAAPLAAFCPTKPCPRAAESLRVRRT